MNNKENLTDDLDLQGFNFDDLLEDENDDKKADNNDVSLQDILDDNSSMVQNAETSVAESLDNDVDAGRDIADILGDDFSEPTDENWNVFADVGSEVKGNVKNEAENVVGVGNHFEKTTGAGGNRSAEQANLGGGNETKPAEVLPNKVEKIVDENFDVSVEHNNSQIFGIEENGKIGCLRWYSGSSNDKMFELEKGFESGNFDADEECRCIHVNVGFDTYGWEVQFSDGVVMNLRDVREYQIRNGRLPLTEGRIIYGQSALTFSGIERIVVYESVKYFSYGM